MYYQVVSILSSGDITTGLHAPEQIHKKHWKQACMSVMSTTTKPGQLFGIHLNPHSHYES